MGALEPRAVRAFFIPKEERGLPVAHNPVAACEHVSNRDPLLLHRREGRAEIGWILAGLC